MKKALMMVQLIVVLGLVLAAGPCFAQDDLPANYTDGWYMTTNSGPINEASSEESEISNPSVTGGTRAIAEAITPDITALARNLMNDPTRIYNYVHDNIRYVHYFGSHKGAEMTLLERSGNDFDQCALLVALLRAAGYSPSYEFGMVSFPYSAANQRDYQHWVGTTMPNTNWSVTESLVNNINLNYGFPYTTFLPSDTNDIVFHHVWVSLDGSVLDPSFKVSLPGGGINLDAAMQINTNTVLTDAGGTATIDSVQGINEGAVRNDLKTYAANLVNFIQSNSPNASVQQIVGGQQIVSSSGQALGQNIAFTVQTDGGAWPTSEWTYIPTNLMAVFSIVLPLPDPPPFPPVVGYPVTNSFFIPGLQGSRLSLVCSSNEADIFQEDTRILEGVPYTTPFYPTLAIQHPYGSWNFGSATGLVRAAWADQSLSSAVFQPTNATYILLYGFDVNSAWLTERQQKLDAYRQHGYADTSPQVIEETLNVMGLDWLVQTELAGEFLASQTTNLYHFQHRIGRMAQEAGRGYYIDVYGQVYSIIASGTTNASGTYMANQAFQIASYFHSAMEHGIIEQLQNSNLVAASTVKLLELANTNSETVYLATLTNWSSGVNVSGNISNYSTGSLYDSYISQGYSLLLPQNGSIPVAGTGSWAGSGYVAFQAQANGAEASKMIIGGGYSGGYVSDPTTAPSPPAITSIDVIQPMYFNPQSATVSLPTAPGADPVNMVDGSFQIASSDLALGQVEPRGLNLTRYYSSARRNYNPAGMAPGWLHSYYCTASPTSSPLAGMGGTTPQAMAPIIVAMRAALNIYNSAQPTPKSWLVTALIAKWGIDQLTKSAVSVNLGNQVVQFIQQPNGSFTPPANSTMALFANGGGYVLQERHGRAFYFGSSSLLTNLVDQYGQSMYLSYNSSNWVSTVTDWKGRTLAFTYTGTNLTSVADSTGRTVHYGYTGLDMTSFTDPDGNTFTYQYDTNHQMTATLDALGRFVVTNNYDINGHITTQLTLGATNRVWQVFASGWQTTMVDPMGGQESYFFDNQSRQTGFQDALGNLTQTFYDGQDHVIQTISPLAETNLLVYDGNNNLIETIDPAGFSNVFTFDGNNNLVASTDGGGNTSHFGYNAQFSLTGSTNGYGDWTVFAFNSDGTLASKQNTGGTIIYGYDSYGQINNITYPFLTGAESFVNNALGDPTSHTDGRSFTTTFAYNLRRQLTNAVAPTNVTAQSTFDANANLSTTTDARGFLTSNNWSATRKLLNTTFPSTPEGTPISTCTYDGRDWLTSSQDPTGNTTRYTNDAVHRLIATTDPLQRTIILGYDGDGHQTNLTDAASETTTQTWNVRGDPVKIIDAATNIVGKAYDGAHNLIYLTNRNGKVWRFQYDAANRLTNTTSPLGHSFSRVYTDGGREQTVVDASGQTTTWVYDFRERLGYREDSIGLNEYVYDGNNNLTNITEITFPYSSPEVFFAYDAYNRLGKFTDVNGNVIQYRYDASGNMTNLIYPGNRTVKYYYDSNNRLTNVTDWAGRQTVSAYDLAGRLTSLTRPNNTARTMSYDADGELTRIVEQAGSQLPICFYTLNYNSAGRVQWEFKGPLPHAYTPPARAMTFDNDNRLATFNGTAVTVDADGNMTYGPGTNNTFETYTYDARNELTSAGGVTYGYDGAGNRLSMTSGGTEATFVIDAQGSQTLMRIMGTTTNYYIYGAGLLYEIDETATTTNTAFYHFDSRGSTVALTDTNGNPTDLIEYSPYGMTTYRYGTNDTPFLYNGQFGVQTDPNGLLYMRARYYNPYISRFINADPSDFAGGLNFFLFCNDNPINAEDPFGLQAAGPINGVIYNPYTGQPLPQGGSAPTWGYVASGVVVGAYTAGAVAIAAPVAVGGLTTLGLSSTAASATVTTAIGVAGVAGAVTTGVNTYNAAQANDWNAVAFNSGTFIGGFAVGVGGGGRGMVEGMMGEPSPAPNTWNPITIFQYEWSKGYDSDYPDGSVASWMASAPTPASGGASATFTATGADSFLAPFGTSSTSQSSPTGK